MVRRYLSLVKFSHTVFALPFALIGFTLAIVSGNGVFTWRVFLLVLACMVLARTAAMAFNRLIDRRFDALNPRTAKREIPAGAISPAAARTLVILCCAAFIGCAWLINPLCFALSPVALTVVLGYSYTKRFTPLCHLILGLGLGLAPIGAYIAVTGAFNLIPLLFSAAVFLWVSGFDIIYALQDETFDRELGLKSIPVLLGRRNGLFVSRLLHALCALVLAAAWFPGGFGWMYLCGVAIFAGLLIYQHSLVSPSDISRVNVAFATSNGVASVIFCVFVCADLLLA